MATGTQGQRISRWPGAVDLNPIIATVTPFTSSGHIDFAAVDAYLNFLHEAGVQAILVNGTTGEFANLTLAERRQLLEHTRVRWPGQLIAHVGATALGDAVALLEHSHEHADAVAAISPYFYADPPGLRAYFSALLDRTELPMLLYNFPRHTQALITPDLFGELASAYPLLVGIKDSGSDRAVTRAYVDTGLPVFVGSDGEAARIGELRAAGIVSGGGSPIPEVPVRIAAAVRNEDTETAERWQSIFDQFRTLRQDSGLSDIAFAKAALSERISGFPVTVRPPLVAASDTRIDDIRGYLRNKILPRIDEVDS
ncbi:dihydrodipicolinate synthase family protein [Nocardia huaxiensis]|uniref:Dihydrodipicolinate synthase family protein n=1 Tax=Nocardia huaxiensis TaxID=2755382 RepID=A0A7D6ZKC0_9NOCA|nr:dihydrodipicolinate synthase family protein [Nocardia huaxiensis]QLY32787.1 dihydrodipicolinate synthase family protein [Nocardia huaxiensis]